MLLFACLLSGGDCFAQEETATNDEKWQLWASGKTMLRGANIYQQEAYGDPWCSKVESSDLKALRDAGANYVNFSVPGVFHVEPPYELNPLFVTELQRIVGLAKLNQLKVVIAFRTGPGRGEGDITESGNRRRNLFFDPEAQQHFIAMWKHVARIMKTEDHVVGYDLLIEPTWKKFDSVKEAEFRDQWRSLARRTIAVIRSVDVNTPVLVELDDWAAPDALGNWTPLYRRGREQRWKIVYAVHQYTPYEYTHKREPFDPDLKELKATFERIAEFRKTYHVPLAVNEFGVKSSRPDAGQFLESQFQLLEQHGINHAIWIWEPADASCSGRHFDINVPQAKSVLDVVRRNWRANFNNRTELNDSH